MAEAEQTDKVLHERELAMAANWSAVLVQGADDFTTWLRSPEGELVECENHGGDFTGALSRFNERARDTRPQGIAGTFVAGMLDPDEPEEVREEPEIGVAEFVTGIELAEARAEVEREAVEYATRVEPGVMVREVPMVDVPSASLDVIQVWHLRFVGGRSRKFYRITLTPTSDGGAWEVQKEWGRIGTEGRSMVERFGSRAQGLWAATSILNKKMKKGYILYNHEVNP